MAGRGSTARISTSLRDMAKQWAVYGIGSVAQQVSGFLLLPVYTRFLSPADYGIRAMAAVSVSVAMIFLELGIRIAVIRFYWDDDGVAHPEVVSTGLVSAACLATLGIGPALWVSDSLAQLIFGSPDYAFYVRLGLIGMFFSYLQEVPRAYLQVTKRSTMFTAISVAALAVSVFLNILFVVFLRSGVAGIFYAEIITNVLFSMLLLGMTLRQVGWSFSFQAFRAIIRYGAPTPLVAVGWLVLNSADRLLLARHASLSEVGIYALAAQFANVLFILLVQPLINVWGPTQFEVSRQPNATELFPRLIRFFTTILLIGALSLSILVEDAIKIVAATPFWPAAVVVPVLALSWVLTGVCPLFKTGILIAKRTEYASLIILLAAGLNVLLNLWLIPTYLALGAAMARTGSLLALVGITYWVSHRVHRIDFKVFALLKTFGYALGLFFLSGYLPAAPPFLSLLLKTGLIMSFLVLVLLSDAWNESDPKKIRAVSAKLLVRLQNGFGGTGR